LRGDPGPNILDCMPALLRSLLVGGEPSPRTEAGLRWASLLAVLLLALAVRLPFVLGADFPLGDGGLFAQIIDDIRAHGGALPAFTSYNGGSIPLCYPPLGFYLVVLSGLPTLKALLWLPLVLSVLVPFAVLLLGRVVLKSEAAALAAGLVAALLPVPCWFGLEGCGLTRSLGLLLTVLTVASVIWASEKPCNRRALLAGIAWAAAELSHPEAALLTPVLVATVVLSTPLRTKLRSLAAMFGVMAALVLPWLALVLLRHGIGPWLAAVHYGAGPGGLALAVPSNVAWWLTGESGAAPLAILALLGLPVALLRRDVLIPVWLLAPVFLVPRNYRFWTAPAIALLVGLAVSALVFAGLDRLARSRPLTTLAKFSVLLAVVASGMMQAREWSGRVSLLAPLPGTEREALAWVAHAHRPGERIATIDREPAWFSTLGEWAPYLCHAESVVVPQGREWLGDAGLFAGRAASLREALATSSEALGAWLAREPTVRWLVVGPLSEADPGVLRTLSAAANVGALRLAYQRGGATVWQSALARPTGR
jgi:hypothetical protein